MLHEAPKFIRSRFGDLFLIEHFDPEHSPTVWIIMLNSGLQCRTGPQRLYLRIARRLAELGYGVLRVDLPGVGDSDGPTPPTHFDMHDPTNVRDILRYVHESHDPDNVLLMGLCAGARVSIKAAMLNQEIDGVIALSMPTFTASPGSERSPEESAHRMSKTVATHNVDRLQGFVRNKRYRDLRFWRRYLNPKNAVAESIYLIRSLVYLAAHRKATDRLGNFTRMLVSLARADMPKLFLFGSRDIIIGKEFEELNVALTNGIALTIPDGTHTFSTYSSSQQVVEEIGRWLLAEFPPRFRSKAPESNRGQDGFSSGDLPIR